MNTTPSWLSEKVFSLLRERRAAWFDNESCYELIERLASATVALCVLLMMSEQQE